MNFDIPTAIVTMAYLLIGFQFGARGFCWENTFGRRGWQTPWFMPVLVPLSWPISLILLIVDKWWRNVFTNYAR